MLPVRNFLFAVCMSSIFFPPSPLRLNLRMTKRRAILSMNS